MRTELFHGDDSDLGEESLGRRNCDDRRLPARVLLWSGFLG